MYISSIIIQLTIYNYVFLNKSESELNNDKHFIKLFNRNVFFIIIERTVLEKGYTMLKNKRLESKIIRN